MRIKTAHELRLERAQQNTIPVRKNISGGIGLRIILAGLIQRTIKNVNIKGGMWVSDIQRNPPALYVPFAMPPMWIIYNLSLRLLGNDRLRIRCEVHRYCAYDERCRTEHEGGLVCFHRKFTVNLSIEVKHNPHQCLI
jgi:hypothetical protein